MTLTNGDSLKFEILPQAFFQVNTNQAEKLYSLVIDFALSSGASTALDLFCGTGTIALFLSKHIERVVGVEMNGDAIFSAKKNAFMNGINNVEFVEEDVHKSEIIKEVSPDLVVLDPPRAGLTEKTVRKISSASPSTIIYVSCNPSTLARDVKLFLELGYSLKKAIPVDMFPQTYHVETVCLLEKSNSDKMQS